MLVTVTFINLCVCDRFVVRFDVVILQIDSQPSIRQGRQTVRRPGASPVHVPGDPARDERRACVYRFIQHRLGHGREGHQGGWTRGLAGDPPTSDA